MDNLFFCIQRVRLSKQTHFWQILRTFFYHFFGCFPRICPIYVDYILTNYILEHVGQKRWNTGFDVQLWIKHFGHLVVGNNYHSQVCYLSQGSFTLTLPFARCYHSQLCYLSKSFQGLASSSYLFSVNIVGVRKFFPFPANP